MILWLLLFGAAVIITTCFGYWAHKFLHIGLMGVFSTSHKTHHEKLYPLNDYKSDIYRSAGKDSATIFFLIISLPLLAMPFVMMLFGILSLFSALFMTASMVFIGWVHDYTHDSFHINNHWLGRIPLFKSYYNYLERMHLIHHKDEMKNFGIITFFWDKIFGTLLQK